MVVLASKTWVQVYNWFPIALKYIHQYTCRFSHLDTIIEKNFNDTNNFPKIIYAQAAQNRSSQQLRMIPVLDHEYNIQVKAADRDWCNTSIR